jgi:hypothetical protein
MSEMRKHSETAWNIASLYSHYLASETRDLAAHIDVALDRVCSGARWQPIETAPKDGRRIWLADTKNLVTGYWSQPVGAWRTDWLVGDAGDKPTHWMPLPDLPKAVTEMVAA